MHELDLYLSEEATIEALEEIQEIQEIEKHLAWIEEKRTLYLSQIGSYPTYPTV